MIVLRYHPEESYFLSTIKPEDGPPSAYVSHGREEYNGVMYQVTTLSFYFVDNIAIGIGWRFFPRVPLLGYHPHDIEHISIYSLNGQNKYVYFSAHSRGQGAWVPWEKCEFIGDDLVVYIARNSHACYAHAGVYPRVFGLANDVCSKRGISQLIQEHQLIPSYDFVFPNGIRLYKGLEPKPPAKSNTALARFILPFHSTCFT